MEAEAEGGGGGDAGGGRGKGGAEAKEAEAVRFLPSLVMVQTNSRCRALARGLPSQDARRLDHGGCQG